MWNKLGHFVLKNRLILLIITISLTALMGYFASKVQLSYEFAKAIPTNNPEYSTYLEFRKKFGDDGNLLVAGIETDKLFTKNIFNDYSNLSREIKKIAGVDDVLSVPGAITLMKDSVTDKFKAVPIFPSTITTQQELDSCRAVFENLLFYRSLLYNQETKAYLLAIRVNPEWLNSVKRTQVVNAIAKATDRFSQKHQLQFHLSGLPLIRTLVANRIAAEMKWFLLGSVLLSAIILFLFFRSLSTTILSLGVVMAGVIWSFGTLYLLGYKITLLTALTPPLIVVITVPNCIYFINKYHTSYRETNDQYKALVNMVEKMGIVTLFCNITAAIGFAVFSLTKSPVLREFGEVAGISIMVIFFISFIVLPTVLFYLQPPKEKHTRYLDNAWMNRMLQRIERWVLHHRPPVYIVTVLLMAFSIAGIFRLKSEGFIVDDLPKSDKIYTDLKWFEKHFKGVMPLEILVDTKKKYGLASASALASLEKIDSLSQYLAAQPEMNRPLCITEGLKFARQAYYDGDSNNYSMPNSFDIAFLAPYLRMKGDAAKANTMSKLSSAFMDSNRQVARISVSMADVGSKRLPLILKDVEKRAHQIFDSSKYNVQITGTAVTFQEGSRFIINGLTESILWAFLLIALCMLYLFRSLKILFCSLIPNLIPLMITAGVMGWTGVHLKPSTVLVFSVALGIAIDVTIRFLVNYKQELPMQQYDVENTVSATIRQTGISIIYTSMVLIAGFVIFMFSSFGGTIALGWLTSLTLFSATVTNLVLLPVLLFSLQRNKTKG
jgi:predicted RND superfamily exporter protein